MRGRGRRRSTAASARRSQHDLDVAEGAGLVEVDQALLVQLEHGQEPHDDLEALDERLGERAEA